MPSSVTDAGKTTITKQLLYFGGEINEAGTVKGKKRITLLNLTGWISKNSVVSLSSSVMQFDYADKRISAIRQEHEDFSEDILTVLLWRVTLQLWLSIQPKVSEAQTKNYLKL